MSHSCDGAGNVVGYNNTATGGSLCVSGVVSSRPYPNNRCYRSNAAYKAGQVWAPFASTTATVKQILLTIIAHGADTADAIADPTSPGRPSCPVTQNTSCRKRIL